MGCVSSSTNSVSGRDRGATSDFDDVGDNEFEETERSNGIIRHKKSANSAGAKKSPKHSSSSKKKKNKRSSPTLLLTNGDSANGDTSATTTATLANGDMAGSLDDSRTPLTANGDCTSSGRQKKDSSKRKTKSKKSTSSLSPSRMTQNNLKKQRASDNALVNGDAKDHDPDHLDPDLTDSHQTFTKQKRKKQKPKSSTSSATNSGSGSKKSNSAKAKSKSLLQLETGDEMDSSRIGAKLAYANEDPTTSPTIPSNNATTSATTSASSANGRSSSASNHKSASSHLQNGSATNVAPLATSVLKQSKGADSPITINNNNRSPIVSTDALHKNFQNRLASTQTSRNIKLTDSQVEFFRMLDEKVERGRDYENHNWQHQSDVH